MNNVCFNYCAMYYSTHTVPHVGFDEVEIIVLWNWRDLLEECLGGQRRRQTAYDNLKHR